MYARQHKRYTDISFIEIEKTVPAGIEPATSWLTAKYSTY